MFDKFDSYFFMYVYSLLLILYGFYFVKFRNINLCLKYVFIKYFYLKYDLFLWIVGVGLGEVNGCFIILLLKLLL